ncbi:MAG: RodZ domain-containing protein [Gallionella sp.]
MMEQIPENNSEPSAPAPVPPLLGAMLREARNQLGMSIADVAAQTKFAPRQIEALEAEDFENLPETAFLRGFVRSYAKILNLDAETLLAALPQAKSPAPELVPASVDVPYPEDHSAQKNLILLAAALLMAVIVAGFAVWHFTTPIKHAAVEKIETPVSLPAEAEVIHAPAAEEHRNIEPPPAAEHRKVEPPAAETRHQSSSEKPAPRKEKAVPAETVPPAKSAVAATHKSTLKQTGAASGTAATTPVRLATGKTSSLHLVFDEESWTEITDGTGKMISSQINPPGSELYIKGQLPLSLVIGHAAATRLYQDGKPVDLAPHTNSSSEVARLILE